jgi:hypothetical protein
MSLQIKLLQLEQRIIELETLAEDVAAMAEKQSRNEKVQPDLADKGQEWYRGARELLVQSNSSSLKEFEDCYARYERVPGGVPIRWHADFETFIHSNSSAGRMFQSAAQASEAYKLFAYCFQKARALVKATIQEIKSRELPVLTSLSFAVSANEFEAAEELMNASNDEPIIRASGVVARVALERHLFTVADSHRIEVNKNPPSKKHVDSSDLLTALVKNGVITQIQRSQLDGLFTIGNHCAHPKETVGKRDCERLILEGKQLASVIL